MISDIINLIGVTDIKILIIAQLDFKFIKLSKINKKSK